MVNKKIKILIADDHRVLLDGITLMLKDVEQLEIVSTALNGDEVLLKMPLYYIDILLMDIQMPVKDGYETAKIVAEKYPDTKIIILSMHNERVYIEKMYNAGVAGYLLKTAGKNEIIEAIEKVYQGGKYFSQEVTAAIIESNQQKGDSLHSSELTKREKEIVKLIAHGSSSKDIAAKLFLSIETIKTHRKNIMRKLDLNSTAAFVKYAVENSTFQLD